MLEFSLDVPMLRETRAEVPEMAMRVERFDATDGRRVRMLLWAGGGDFATFEAALEADRTVATPTRVVDFRNGRLYQTELVGAGLETSVYPTIVEVGGVVYEVLADGEGWRYKVGFPDQRTFERFWRFCARHELRFALHRRYEGRDLTGAGAYGLTEAQCEVLQTALAAGYLEIPRHSSLAELAERLGISENAASERFRRAAKALVAATVGSDER
ncbi:helix-turn-helix domain-containing protein [Haloarchaeobius amylolyticus]|uniref:helix-turn-helix domain-containing protein n=1 Tax=Haloarchaeobius amylolyticus TaxID=1198296 RepID=UPI00226E0702